MRRAGFVIVGFFPLKDELHGSMFLLTAVGGHPNVLSRLPGLVAQVLLFLSQIHCCLGGMGQPWGPSSLVRNLH